MNHFKSDIQTPLVPDDGDYLVNLSIGIPPVQILGVASTGSDLIWIQCKPCKKCYNQTLPVFDPHRSTTYQNLSCDSNPTCEYSYLYGDGSYTKEVLAAETLTLGINQPVSLPNVVFGCGHDNKGTFHRLVSGVIGLGGGQLSSVSQMVQSVRRKFSYCLVPSSYTSNQCLRQNEFR